jgi:hypothetical protein
LVQLDLPALQALLEATRQFLAQQVLQDLLVRRGLKATLVLPELLLLELQALPELKDPLGLKVLEDLKGREDRQDRLGHLVLPVP